MKGLAALLGGASMDEKSGAPTGPGDTDGDSEFAEDSADAASDENFSASASEAMEALKAGDTEAFAEALRACIEMSS